MFKQPQSFALIAMDYARSAQACGEVPAALSKLQSVYSQAPTMDVLTAIGTLQPDAAERRDAIMQHLRQQPSLSAAQSLIRERLVSHVPLDEPEVEVLQKALTSAAKPLQRYRCAACGFESQHYFWQCPGCQTWDSYPPRRLEDQ
jgi:lipopolysaccharide biosynthesis regulator YciM